MKIALTSSLALITIMSHASPNTIWVDPNDSGGKAHATIQSAVDAAGPGDIVSIKGGVYYEHVQVNRGGTPERPLTIQAAENETVLINAGRRLDAKWQLHDASSDVYAARIDDADSMADGGIWEMPSRLRLASVASVRQVSQRLGSWYYDSDSRTLYLRGTGRAPVADLEYWLEAPEASAVQINADHVHVRNLQATLGQQGFLIRRGRLEGITIEDCRAFCNSWAGIHVTGNNHRILRNETFENNTYGIQLRFGVNNVHVLDNICLFNGPNNGEATGSSVPTDLGIYSQGEYNLFVGNIAEGLHEDVYRNKTGHGAARTNVLRNNVIIGNQSPGPFGVYDNTLLVSGLGMRAGMYRNGGLPSPLRSWEFVDPDGIQRATNLIHPLVNEQDPRFVDPAYRDYRLQADSPYLGHGAHPGISPVYFVDPAKGSASHTGLSEGEALATLEQALERVPAGGTIYLMPGSYDNPVTIASGGLIPQEPLRIRAHGKQPGVVLAGTVTLDDQQYVELDGLEIKAPLKVENVTGLTVINTVFSGGKAGIQANNSRALRVDRCTFAGNDQAISLTDSPQASITQSLFKNCRVAYAADAASADTLFADFNGFDTCAVEINGNKITDLTALRNAHGLEAHGLNTDIALNAGYAAPARGILSFAGVDFGHLGARIEGQDTELKVHDLRIAGLSPEGASLLWETPRATYAEITLKDASGNVLRKWEPNYMLQIMGTFFDITRLNQAFFSSQRHAVIEGLEPQTAYTVELVPRDQVGNRGKATRVGFETPATYAAPVTYYLNPEGSDEGDGRSPDRAWRSFAHALAQVGPGDELVLLPGHYREILRPRVSGTAGHPITIRAQTPLAAVLDLDQSLPVAVEVINANHITVDGLLITGGAFPRSQCFVLNHARGITIRNCEVDYPERSSFDLLRLGYGGLVAHQAPDLTVENNLFVCCVWGVALSHAPNTRVLGNTIVGEGNYGVVIVPGSHDERYTIEHNIFYRAVMGYKTGPAIWVFDPMPELVSDFNVFHIPEEHKGTIGKLPSTDRLFPLAQWQEGSGLDQSSIAAQPLFVDPENRDFTLRPDSPGQNMPGRPAGRIP